ncbi:hypothetical protein 9F2_8 [uncultured Caudovirales phage]|uniref:Uncharacterized protein n=1 Tax=uncultured Caudovirales phage TaxID=2100421 RepID=A0A2H4J8B7_9CAUD|nr:hypothetical protein 9F2_8 [uncultured Caudovirales phage]
MKVRALAILNTPGGTKEIGDTYDLAADKVPELEELGWIEKAKETAPTTKADKAADAADAKA